MAFLFGCLALIVIGFQVALIFGAPWGHLTQGGRFAGPLPPAGRIAAALSAVVLAMLVLGVFSAAGKWPYWPAWTGWAAVGVIATSTLLNWITPSRAERRLWAPINTAMLILALIIVWR